MVANISAWGSERLSVIRDGAFLMGALEAGDDDAIRELIRLVRTPHRFLQESPLFLSSRSSNVRFGDQVERFGCRVGHRAMQDGRAHKQLESSLLCFDLLAPWLIPSFLMLGMLCDCRLVTRIRW